MGKPVHPPVVAYSSYDPRDRPWYSEGRTHGADWSSDILTWGSDYLISASISVAEKFGKFRGVLNAAASIANIESELSSVVPEGAVLYAMQKDTGELVFTSIPGLSGEVSGSSYVQNYAAASESRAIRESACELQRHDDDYSYCQTSTTEYTVPSVNPFLWEGYWIEVEEISKIGGLSLRSPWLFVVIQEACTTDFFFKKTNGASSTFVTKASSLGDCHPCPENAKCAGGLALPYPKKGFWMDTSKPKFLYKDAMCCSRNYEDGGTCIISDVSCSHFQRASPH